MSTVPGLRHPPRRWRGLTRPNKTRRDQRAENALRVRGGGEQRVEVRRWAARAVGVLTAILNRRNLVTIDLDKSIAIDAIQFCAPSGRVSFADAMIWATARSFGIPIIYTV
ncbi:MAG: hypothetical protein DCC49_09375 [Acidobacteria bacterium]|nr:MAG: hypothetical protein DCC49_09375 [Acidobacteriota bacterium]